MYNNICLNYAKKGNENKKKFNYFKLFFIFHFTFVRINKKKALFEKRANKTDILNFNYVLAAPSTRKTSPVI